MKQALRFLTDDERARLLARADTLEFTPDETILRGGEPQEAIYLVRAGTARVENDRGTPISTVGVGEAFGEMSLLDGSITSASVVADDAVTVDVLRLDWIADLLEEDAELAAHLYHSLAVLMAERLRERTDELG